MKREIIEFKKIGNNENFYFLNLLENGVKNPHFIKIDDDEILQYIEEFQQSLKTKYKNITKEEAEKSRDARIQTNIKALPIYIIGILMFFGSGLAFLSNLLGDILTLSSTILLFFTAVGINTKKVYMDNKTIRLLETIENDLRRMEELKPKAIEAIAKRKEREDEELKKKAQRRKYENEMRLNRMMFEFKRATIQNSDIIQQAKQSSVGSVKFTEEKTKKSGAGEIPDYLKRTNSQTNTRKFRSYADEIPYYLRRPEERKKTI